MLKTASSCNIFKIAALYIKITKLEYIFIQTLRKRSAFGNITKVLRTVRYNGLPTLRVQILGNVFAAG